MVVQNSYLRAPDAANVAEFIFREGKKGYDILSQQVNLLQMPGLVGRWLIGVDSEHGLSDFFASMQAGLGILLFGFVCLIALLASWQLLRATAAEGRQHAQKNAESLAKENNTTADEIKKRLKRMQFWPVGWIRESELLIWMLVLFASLFSYRIVLIPVLILAARVFDVAIKLIFRRRTAD
jgi:hypothetical protein